LGRTKINTKKHTGWTWLLFQILGVLFFAATISYWIFSYKYETTKNEQFVLEQVNQTSSEIESFYKTIKNGFNILSQKALLHKRIQSDERKTELHDIARTIAEIHDSIEHVIVLDADGNPITSSDLLNVHYGKFPHQEWLDKLKIGNHIEVSEPTISKYGILHAKKVVFIGKSFVGFEGEIGGYIVFSMYPELFFSQKFYKNMLPKALVELHHKNGETIITAGRGERDEHPIYRNLFFEDQLIMDVHLQKYSFYNKEFLEHYGLQITIGFLMSLIVSSVGFYIRYRQNLEELKYIDRLEQEVQERTTDLVVAKEDLETKNNELRDLNGTLKDRITKGIERYREQQSILFQQSKMAAMGEMIGAIVHQWKQPLNNISISTDLIEDGWNYKDLSDEKLNKYLGTIRGQVSFMNSTIETFRNFFKPSKEKVKFMPCEEINETSNLLLAKMKKHNTTITLHEHEHFYVFGFQNEFKQVLLNIFSNAIDVFSERGVKDGRIEVFIEHKDKFGILRIRDNGGGIPDELLPDRLFEPYVTTKGENGTGIGLQISQTIIKENMGGKLWAHNVDSGAEFVIELPKC